jgi:outer membrane protein assembly factor BamB
MVVALDPGTGRRLWSKTFAGNIFAPITGVRGLVFIGTDASRYFALSTTTGAQEWTYGPPAPVGGGASIVGAYVIWGYGFTLFKAAGQGGIVCFSLTGAGRAHQESGGMEPSNLPMTTSR